MKTMILSDMEFTRAEMEDMINRRYAQGERITIEWLLQHRCLVQTSSDTFFMSVPVKQEMVQ